MIRVLKVKIRDNLIDFSRLLTIHNINHKISEEAGYLIIWTDKHNNIDTIKSLYYNWEKTSIHLKTKQQDKINFNLFDFIYQLPWKQQKVSYIVTLINLVVWLFFMANPQKTIAWLMFARFNLMQPYIVDPWRLITPIFLHFNLTHLLFNIATFLILASKIEYNRGSLILLVIIIVGGVFANWLQFFCGNTVLFGGSSGVVYALLGYCAVFQLLIKKEIFGIPPAYSIVMLIWLLLGYTNFTVLIGIGKIGNYAHIGGLFCGVIIALASFFFQRLRSYLKSR